MHLAAMTYSLARSCLTSVRTTLAMLVQLVRPMTSAMLHALGVPMIACKKMTSSRFGTLRRISVRRISSASSHLGESPLTAPKRIASSVEMRVEPTPMNSDSRPPYQIIEKISRPIVSVPNRNSRHGAAEQWARSRYVGSFVMISSQKRHPSTMSDKITAEATGLPRRGCPLFVGAASGSGRAPTIWKRSFMAAPPFPAQPARRGCAGRSAR